MNENEFRRLLDLFPVVRPRNYHLKDSQDACHEGKRKEIQNQGIDLHDKFWQKLKLTAERKMGAAEADKLCEAFRHVHKKLVYEGMSFDAAQKFLNSRNC